MGRVFQISWADIRQKILNRSNEVYPGLGNLGKREAVNAALGVLDAFLNDFKFEFDLDVPELNGPDYANNPLKDAFNKGELSINTAIDDFNSKIVNPISNFMKDVNAVKDQIVGNVGKNITGALQNAEDLQADVQRILGEITTQAYQFLHNLPDINSVNDQIIEMIVQQIINAVKTGETNLNEKNLMIYSGEFKSGFNFTIPAVNINADFDIKIGPGTV